MKEKSVFEKLYIALLKPSEYRNFIHLSTVRVIGYFFLVIFVFSIIVTPKIASDQSRDINNYLGKLESNIPVIVIEKGEVSSDVAQPYEITDIDNFKIVLDTTNKTTTLEQGILIQKDSIVIFPKNRYPGSNPSQKYSLSSLLQPEVKYVIDNTLIDKIQAFLNMRFLIVSNFLLIFFTYSIIGFLWLFIVSIPITIFNSALKAELSYGQLLILEVFALIPALFIKIIWILLGIKFYLAFRVLSSLMIIVYLVYLWIAIKKISSDGGLKVTTTTAPTISAAVEASIPPPSVESEKSDNTSQS